jgi:hypothetical protein
MSWESDTNFSTKKSVFIQGPSLHNTTSQMLFNCLPEVHLALSLQFQRRINRWRKGILDYDDFERWKSAQSLTDILTPFIQKIC